MYWLERMSWNSWVLRVIRKFVFATSFGKEWEFEGLTSWTQSWLSGPGILKVSMWEHKRQNGNQRDNLIYWTHPGELGSTSSTTWSHEYCQIHGPARDGHLYEFSVPVTESWPAQDHRHIHPAHWEWTACGKWRCQRACPRGASLRTKIICWTPQGHSLQTLLPAPGIARNRVVARCSTPGLCSPEQGQKLDSFEHHKSFQC